MPSPTFLFRTTPLAVFAALALAACGGGSSPTAIDAAADAAEGVPVAPPTSDAAPPTGGTTAPDPMTAAREPPASATCSAPAYAHPRVAAWDMTRDTTTTRQALLAKFDLAIVGMAPANLGPFAAGIKQINPAAKVAQYVNVADLPAAATSSEEAWPLVQAVTSRHWWLTAANGSLASWTGGATAGVNLTGWTSADAAGLRWPQWKAQYDVTNVFGKAPAVDYAFVANTFVRPRVTADWKRIGSDQSPSDSTVQSAMRAGYAAYWNALRTAQPVLKVMAGTDSDLSAPEYKGQADAAYLDGMIGQPWSIETWAGWDAMLRHYRSTLADVKPGKAVVFAVFGSSPTDYATLRYGLASALLDDGTFLFRAASGSQAPALYDEYLAPLGQAVDAPPTAPASNGIWLRRYENGLVLVNPQTTSATIDVGTGYQRLAGTQDPAVNNGQSQQVVTLGGRQGLVMLKVPAPCLDLATLARPKVAALDYSMNITDARKALLAQFDVVILGLSKSLGATAVNSFVGGIRKLNPAVRIGQYTILNELKCDLASTDERYPLWQEVNRSNWWLRTAAGARTQWNTSYGACDINVTSHAPRNAAGQTYAQFKWQFDRSTYFSLAPFDFLFNDNTFGLTRTQADWLLAGYDQPKADPTASAEMRAGYVAYWNAVHATDPALKIVGNVDNTLDWPEYKGQLDGGFLEGALGKSWSRETWAGWDSMMGMYRSVLRNVRQSDLVFLNAYAATTDYATVRYGLASSMMEDGRFVFLPSTGTLQPSWFDEFGAPIGAVVDAPPTAPAANGIWLRHYANGLVLVNPSKTATASIDVGPGYKRLAGTQDPTVNNGQPQQVVTLGPRQGLLMLRQ